MIISPDEEYVNPDLIHGSEGIKTSINIEVGEAFYEEPIGK